MRQQIPRGDFYFAKGDTLNNQSFNFWNIINKQKVEQDISLDTFNLSAYQIDTKVLEFTVGDGFEFIAPNRLNMSKTATQMNIPVGTYPYEFKQIKADGTIKTVRKGNFKIFD